MKLQQIQDEWAIDSKIDKTILGDESIKSHQLHSKYYKMFIDEKMAWNVLRSDLKKLYLDKYEFYTQGPTEEQHEKGWQLPPKGIILKNEVEKYLDADDDLIKLSLKIDAQKEKVDFLVSILSSINQRSFNIRNAITWEQWLGGTG